jgi:hypothetical protein
LYFCPFSFGHWFICPFLICGFIVRFWHK